MGLSRWFDLLEQVADVLEGKNDGQGHCLMCLSGSFDVLVGMPPCACRVREVRKRVNDGLEQVADGLDRLAEALAGGQAADLLVVERAGN